jgi:hypothetical protein
MRMQENGEKLGKMFVILTFIETTRKISLTTLHLRELTLR